MSKKDICRLVDSELIVAPHDEGSPPSWASAFRGEEVVWVDREIFDKLKKLIDEKPCEICPAEIKKKCKVVLGKFTNEELEKFKSDLEDQEKMVNKRIGPILEQYDKGKIKRRELVEKLSEAFHDLEKNGSIE